MSPRAKKGPEADEREVEACALRIVTRREHSVAQLRAKLLARGFDPARIEAVIARFLAWRYLDDARFARALARETTALKARGIRTARQALQRAGVAEEPMREALEEARATQDEAATLSALIRKKLALLNRVESGKRRDKLIRYLVGRGFDYEPVRRSVDEALRACGDEPKEEMDDDDFGA